MSAIAKKRLVGRGVMPANKFIGESYMADKNTSNLAIRKQYIAPARAIAILKNPELETLTEAVEWILQDYIRLHNLTLTEKAVTL